MQNNEDLDFTEDEIQTILNSRTANDGRLAKEWGITTGSIKAMRRYLGPKRMRAAPKLPNTSRVATEAMAMLETDSDTIAIQYYGSTMFVKKYEVTAIQFNEAGILILK